MGGVVGGGEAKQYDRAHDAVVGLRGGEVGVPNHGRLLDAPRVCHVHQSAELAAPLCACASPPGRRAV